MNNVIDAPGSKTLNRVHCLGVGRTSNILATSGRYGRMFPQLRPLEVTELDLVKLGQPGAECDGETTAEASKTEAGWPFFGQLIAHDLTADRSLVDHGADKDLVNFRVAKLDLECVYAGGPSGSGYLYDYSDAASFLLAGTDMPRNAQGIAIIGDARNDSHFFMNRMHLAIMQAHNAIVALLKDSGCSPDKLFSQARQRVVWFYQWIIVNEFLPVLIGKAETESLLASELTSALSKEVNIPVEFADAAFRYGHSQIRNSYQLVHGGPSFPLFPDLLGFRPVPESKHLDFATLFDRQGSEPAQRAMQISEKMARPMIHLPTEITGALTNTTYRSLAARDLRRGLSTALPSGEDVAKALALPLLSPDDIEVTVSPKGTPLFYYILREAAVLGGGNRLGPVGGRIVADVLISCIRRDPLSFLVREPDWNPGCDDVLNVNENPGLIDLLDLALNN
jgi:hypothetical protein